MEHLTLTPDTDFCELFKPSDTYICCNCCFNDDCTNDDHDRMANTNTRAALVRLSFVQLIDFLLEFLGNTVGLDPLVKIYITIHPLLKNARFDPECDPNDAYVSIIDGTLEMEIISGYPSTHETPNTTKALAMATLIRSGEWRVVYNDTNERALLSPQVHDFITTANDFAEELRYFAANGVRRSPFCCRL